MIHALDRSREDLAAELLAAGSSLLVRILADYDRFFELAQRIGAEQVAQWPEIEAAAIWVLAVGNRQRLAGLRLDELEARIPELQRQRRSFVPQSRTPFDRVDPETAMRCWVDMLRIVIAGFGGDAVEARERGLRWLEQYPRATEYDRATVRAVRAQAAAMLGHYAEAEREGRAAMTSFREDRIPFGLGWSAAGTAYAQVRQGRTSDARDVVGAAFRQLGAAASTRLGLPLRMVGMLVLFESGEFHAGLVGRPASEMLLPLRAETARLADIASPVMALELLRGGVRGLLAMGEGVEALRMIDSASFDGAASAVSWWQQQLAIERARTAAIAGLPDRRSAVTIDDAELLPLIDAACRRPDTSLLRPLRARIEAAEEACDADAWALAMFLKARVESASGQALQAKRSVQRLLTAPQARERVGTLASLAVGLRPLFEAVLRDLLANPSTNTAPLRRLAQILGLPTSLPQAPSPEVALTLREREIAAALLQGCSNREIAQRLYLTEKTVKWHLGRLFQKLGVRNRVGAIRTLTLEGRPSPV